MRKSRGVLRKNKRESEQGRDEMENGEWIKKACYIKIQLEIKKNAASNGGMWEDSISSPPPPINEIRSAFSAALENFINMLCTDNELSKNLRKIKVEVKISANGTEHRWLNAS